MRFRIGLIVTVVFFAGCGGEDRPPASGNAKINDQRAGASDSSQRAGDDKPEPAESTVLAPSKDGPDSRPQLTIDKSIRDKLAKLARAGGKDDAIQSELEELDAETKRQLLELLQDDSADVRRGAAFFFMGRELTDPKIAAAFSVTLNDPVAEIRHIGLQAIRHMPEDVLAETVPELVKFVAREDETRTNRVSAARLIGTLDAQGRTAFSQLEQTALAETDEQVRKACLYSISKIAQAADAVALYRQVLSSDAPPGVRRVAAFWLGKLGRDAVVAVDDLAAALEDPSEDVRKEARNALVEVGAQSVPALVSKLASKDSRTRGHAVIALGELEAAAKPALPELRKLLQDDDEEVRKLAARIVPLIESAQ